MAALRCHCGAPTDRMTKAEILSKARAFLLGRKQAYQRRLGGVDIDTRIVLQDLAKFCRAHETTFHPDPRVHAHLEGRREVWLRIASHLNLDEQQLWEIYGRKDQ